MKPVPIFHNRAIKSRIVLTCVRLVIAGLDYHFKYFGYTNSILEHLLKTPQNEGIIKTILKNQLNGSNPH